MRSGTGGAFGKNSGPKMTNSYNTPKVTSAKTSTPLIPKTSAAPSTSAKSYVPSSYAAPKSRSTIGIIWLPGRKKNKAKDGVFVSNRSQPDKDRAPSMYNFMSDSHQTSRKEESDLLVGDSSKVPVALAGASATAAIVEPAITNQPEEKQELLDTDKDKDENKEGSGDSQGNEKKNDSDYSEHNESTDKLPESKSEKEKGDNVDSVYLRPPPPHKVRSNASTSQAEEEDCGIKCLYYTLQCCDCVLM